MKLTPDVHDIHSNELKLSLNFKYKHYKLKELLETNSLIQNARFLKVITK